MPRARGRSPIGVTTVRTGGWLRLAAARPTSPPGSLAPIGEWNINIQKNSDPRKYSGVPALGGTEYLRSLLSHQIEK